MVLNEDEPATLARHGLETTTRKGWFLMAANAECARAREVVKALENLLADLKERPMRGEYDPRVSATCLVVCNGEEDADLSAAEARAYNVLQYSAELRNYKPALASADEDVAFRAPLPRAANAKTKG